MDNVQYFWGWDLKGNGKAAFQGFTPHKAVTLHKAVVSNPHPSLEKVKSCFPFNSSLCGTYDMDGVHFTQRHIHYELYRPYFNKPATSGKHLRCMLKLHPEEIQQYTFATVFL